MSTQPFSDRPKLLADASACTARSTQLREPHIAALTAFVEKLRAQVGPDASIPNFDPWDGGIDAEILYLLEAPGPKAMLTGFVSRNNPDNTAKNFFELNAEAKIPRKRTVTWNIDRNKNANNQHRQSTATTSVNGSGRKCEKQRKSFTQRHSSER